MSIYHRCCWVCLYGHSTALIFLTLFFCAENSLCRLFLITISNNHMTCSAWSKKQKNTSAPGESTHTLFIHSHTLYTLYTPFIWKVYRVYGKCIEWTDFIHSIHFSYTLYTFYMRVNQRWMKFRPPLIHFWSYFKI